MVCFVLPVKAWLKTVSLLIKATLTFLFRSSLHCRTEIQTLSTSSWKKSKWSSRWSSLASVWWGSWHLASWRTRTPTWGTRGTSSTSPSSWSGQCLCDRAFSAHSPRMGWLVKWRGHTRPHNVINQPCSYTLNRNKCFWYLTQLLCVWLMVISPRRLISSILAVLQIEGFDVKALRAFRVLRPLRLISGVPSMKKKCF